MASHNAFSLLDPSNNRSSTPAPGSSRPAAEPVAAGPSNGLTQPRKKKHRAGRKHKRPRRQSFAASPERRQTVDDTNGPGLYLQRRNISNESFDSEALLDHREQRYGPRPRRPSTLLGTPFQQRSDRDVRLQTHGEESEGGDENAPLLSSSGRRTSTGYGSRDTGRNRRGSSRSSQRPSVLHMTPSERYNVNYPPSIPGSPALGPSDSRADLTFGDEMIREQLAGEESGDNSMVRAEEALRESPFRERRHTIALQAEEDVCFPQEGMSELGEEELHPSQDDRARRRRRWRNKWPDLSVLEEWSRLEKESRSEGRRMKRITEPQLINGRLRPVHKGWYRTEEDAPYRFTYFNEEFESTIHSQTISELVQPDSSFQELFIPDAPILSDSEDDDEPDMPQRSPFQPQDSTMPTRQTSFATTLGPTSERLGGRRSTGTLSPKNNSGNASDNHSRQPSADAAAGGAKSPPEEAQPAKPETEAKPIRYGERPVWWLDVLSPTEAEMKILQKAFGIHPLTTEDIMMQEQREKVELFRHYYFVNYRSFDQDAESETHLDPVNMYVVVFREGVISFHFGQTPHPANVRRRIRQLKDFMVLSADWISYAIIDDITDVFVPLIQSIEEEVDEIDDAIMKLHRSADPAAKNDEANEKRSIANETTVESDTDMLLRVGNCRKKVMSLYRLLGNKADVIKGFAKRCNEHWEVAPRSEIGLYLGDIQDHIVTMTGSLSHYEMILARAHGNYLAQINIRMTERSEETADTLGKLTVLGTIVLPMNIITGLWGMNVWVPGQEAEGDLTWFACITAGLIFFGAACYLIAKRIYKIV